MADPILLLRQATILMKEADDGLDATAATQALRWGRLRRVVEDAGDQYWDMRIEAIEESLRDKGAPMWLSVVVSVGLTLIPITALTTRFLGSLTTATQKLLTRSERARRDRFDIQLEREHVDTWIAVADQRAALAAKIAKTEEAVAHFFKQRDPEVSNMLQNYASELAQSAANWPFKRGEIPKTVTKGPKGTAPIVVVKGRLHDWIDTQMNAEVIARGLQKERVKNLFAIATAPDPKKESQELYKAAQAAEAVRQPKAPARRKIEPLPEKSEEALTQLAWIRDDSKPTPDDLFTISEKDELTELQLIIEGAIWASAYDFTPIISKDKSPIGPAHVQHVPLPDELWKRLIERYIDPDAKGASYKDSGPNYRLGTVSKPGLDEKTSRELRKFNVPSEGWSPKTRLSWFFGQVLYPELKLENSNIVQTIKSI